jgi:cytidyltransferase-like protein
MNFDSSKPPLRDHIIHLADFQNVFSAQDSSIIFGGTFDPIHQGHVSDIKALNDLANTVFIAPTEQNPWKNSKPTPLEDRIEMISLVLRAENIPFSYDKMARGLIILTSPYVFAHELTKELTILREEKLFWAIGQDLVESAPSWKEWEKKGVPFVVLPFLEGFSSTKTRSNEIKPHPAISNYIKIKNLYPEGCIKKK